MNNTHIPRFMYGKHSDRQKKQKSTKEKMDRLTPMKTTQVWNGLYPAAAVVVVVVVVAVDK